MGHTYSFEVTDKSIAWVVDGVTYRKEDISDFADVKQSVHASAFQEFISVWGKSASDPGEGIPAFRTGLGVLDDNSNSFPLYSGTRDPLGMATVDFRVFPWLVSQPQHQQFPLFCHDPFL